MVFLPCPFLQWGLAFLLLLHCCCVSEPIGGPNTEVFLWPVDSVEGIFSTLRNTVHFAQLGHQYNLTVVQPCLSDAGFMASCAGHTHSEGGMFKPPKRIAYHYNYDEPWDMAALKRHAQFIPFGTFVQRLQNCTQPLHLLLVCSAATNSDGITCSFI